MLGPMNPGALPPRRMRKFAVALLALLLGLSLAGCGAKKEASETKAQAQSTLDGSKLAAVWPLTGLLAGSKTPRHPVLAVKIPNTAESYPQVGMSQADMVSEELVEGGISRLAVFFYSKVPALVGPVRSMRASDMGIVKPLRAVLVSSGAAPPTLRRLSRQHIPFYTGGTGYFRDSSTAPYNLMVHLRELVATMKKKAVVPSSYLPWGTASDFSGGKRARQIAVRFSAGHTTEWKYAGGKYINTNSYARANDRFNPATVLVLRVREGNAGYLDPAGNPVPETIFHGKGALSLFHNGKVVHGTWSKKRLASPLALSTKKGALKVPAGRVWLELTPVDQAGGNVSWTK